MPSTTRLFGLILIVLGIGSYTMTGRTSLTAMIPAFFGAAFLIGVSWYQLWQRRRDNIDTIDYRHYQRTLSSPKPNPANRLAVIVADGETAGQSNIDYVVDVIRANGKDFLLDVIGSKEEGLKQIFSSASEHSSLIIEYVQRFGDFSGFFTKKNVAGLTEAAGVEESLRFLQEESSR